MLIVELTEILEDMKKFELSARFKYFGKFELAVDGRDNIDNIKLQLAAL